MKNTYRHGDISFHKTNKESDLKEIKHKGTFTVAEGEHTGHHHVISVEKPEDMKMFQKPNGQYVIELFGTGTLVHPEHKPLKLEPGIYEQKQEREFDYFQNEITRVAD